MAKKFLNLISGEHNLVLNRLTGRKTFSNSSDIFYYVDSFFNKKSSNIGICTQKRKIEIYETIPDTKFTFMEMFESLPGEWNKKWLSESQITKVCKHFKSWLRTDMYSSFVLCNITDFVNEDAPYKNLVVVGITMDGEELQITKLDLDSPMLRNGDFLNRIIVPKNKHSKRPRIKK